MITYPLIALFSSEFPCRKLSGLVDLFINRSQLTLTLTLTYNDISHSADGENPALTCDHSFVNYSLVSRAISVRLTVIDGVVLPGDRGTKC